MRGFAALSDIEDFLRFLSIRSLGALRLTDRANAAAYRSAVPWAYARHVVSFLTDPAYAPRPCPGPHEEQLLEHYGDEISRGVFVGPPGVPRIKLFTSACDRATVRWSFETQKLAASIQETRKLLGSAFAQLGWKVAGYAHVTDKWHDVQGNGCYKDIADDKYALPGMAMVSVRRKAGCACSLCLDDSPPCEFPL
jgi:hypothetical protein